MNDNKHYQAICEFYGPQRAARSGVPLIDHIKEGVAILGELGSSQRAIDAFCIHPLLQDDGALCASMQAGSVFARHQPDPMVVVLAMEYRRVANAYLAHHCAGADDIIALSPLAEVADMLIADKVQNRKDFEIYHIDSHANRIVLDLYFKNWLRRLGVSEERYAELCALAKASGAG